MIDASREFAATTILNSIYPKLLGWLFYRQWNFDAPINITESSYNWQASPTNSQENPVTKLLKDFNSQSYKDGFTFAIDYDRLRDQTVLDKLLGKINTYKESEFTFNKDKLGRANVIPQVQDRFITLKI